MDSATKIKLQILGYVIPEKGILNDLIPLKNIGIRSFFRFRTCFLTALSLRILLIYSVYAFSPIIPCCLFATKTTYCCNQTLKHVISN